MRGVFITFEGVEGAGKSSRVLALSAALAARGVPCRVTREPGGTPVAERIRRILLDPKFAPSPLCELMLFLAARADNIRTNVEPWLKEGVVVIADRFTDATLAYQAWGRGLPRSEVEAACVVAAQGLVPDLTFLLDLEPEEGMKRLEGTGRKRDRIEAAGMDFHGRVREGYLALAREAPSRFTVLRGDLAPSVLDTLILTGTLAVLRDKNGSREP